MKSRYFKILIWGLAIICFSLNSLAGVGNNQQLIEELQAEFKIENDHMLRLQKHILKLKNRSDRSAESYLEYIFYKTHQKFLKSYEKHTSIEDMFQSGNYDCVSGSLIYDMILTQLNIEHSIIETDYHVFIIVNYQDQEYIFESTDAFYGFISKQEDVENFKAKYQPQSGALGLKSAEAIGSTSDQNEDDFTIYNEINSSHLIGLQFYNNGIEALNKKEYRKAVLEFNKAIQFYPSTRILTIRNIALGLLQQ